MDGCLVAQVGNVSPTEPWSESGESLGIVVQVVGSRVQFEFAQVDQEDVLPRLQIWQLNLHDPVEPAWSEQSRVQSVLPVRSCQYYHRAICAEPIHLHQQLVQCAVSFIIPSESFSFLPHCVYLIYKYYAWRLLLCLIKQFSHSTCS